MSEPTLYRSLRDPDAYEMRCMMDLLAEGGPGQPPFLVSVERCEHGLIDEHRIRVTKTDGSGRRFVTYEWCPGAEIGGDE